MVKFQRESSSAYGVAAEVERVDVLGISSDSVFHNSALDYKRIEEPFSTIRPPTATQLLSLREHGVKDVGIGFNVLFFLPQMDEPVDPEILRFFRNNGILPEEIICSWLKNLNQQNKRFEALRTSGGFTEDDFKALRLPIKIPLGIVFLRIYPI